MGMHRFVSSSGIGATHTAQIPVNYRRVCCPRPATPMEILAVIHPKDIKEQRRILRTSELVGWLLLHVLLRWS
jgi:hypothetical protein